MCMIQPSNNRPMSNFAAVSASMPSEAALVSTTKRKPFARSGTITTHVSSVKYPVGVIRIVEYFAAPCRTRNSSENSGLRVFPGGMKKVGPESLEAKPERIIVMETLQ